jgi:hypothetical protein
MEEKHCKIQETMFKNQLNYFKNRDKDINDMQLNKVKAIIGLTKVMGMVLLRKQEVEVLIILTYQKKKFFMDSFLLMKT